jgi:hypothetical protein
MKRTILAGILFSFSFASTAQITVSLDAFKDNTIYESATGSLSNGAGEFFFAGNNSSGRIRRTLIKFDIAAGIPAGATITSAELVLTVNQSHPTTNNISLHALSSDWGEGSSNAGAPGGSGAAAASGDATWLYTFFSGSLWTNAGGDFDASASAVTAVSSSGSYSWSSSQMVADVQSWLDGASTNFGWEVIGDESAPQTAKRFASRESSVAADQPSLIVTYIPPPCNDPVISSVVAVSDTICRESVSIITVTGNLNDASSWNLYSGNCGGPLVASNTSGIFNVTPDSTDTYFVRGEGGCVTSATCDQVTVTVIQPYDPTFFYGSPAYCQNDTDPAATITGTPGGTFSVFPTGAVFVNSAGMISLSASMVGLYYITYDPGGECPVSSTQALTINPVYFTNIADTICPGGTYTLGTQTLNAAGNYMETFQAVTGCDSLVSLSLSIRAVDTSVVVSPGMISAVSSAGTYQWMECTGNTILPGETSQNYVSPVPGYYALIIADNGCVDTSSCYEAIVCTCSITGTNYCAYHGMIKSNPNPVKDKVSIDLGKSYKNFSIELFDLQGNTLLSNNFEGKQIVDLDLSTIPSGIYNLKVRTIDRTSVLKLVKN